MWFGVGAVLCWGAFQGVRASMLTSGSGGGLMAQSGWALAGLVLADKFTGTLCSDAFGSLQTLALPELVTLGAPAAAAAAAPTGGLAAVDVGSLFTPDVAGSLAEVSKRLSKIWIKTGLLDPESWISTHVPVVVGVAVPFACAAHAGFARLILHGRGDRSFGGLSLPLLPSPLSALLVFMPCLYLPSLFPVSIPNLSVYLSMFTYDQPAATGAGMAVNAAVNAKAE